MRRAQSETTHLNGCIVATLAGAVGRTAFCVTRPPLRLAGASGGGLEGSVEGLSEGDAEGLWHALSGNKSGAETRHPCLASEGAPLWRTFLPETSSFQHDVDVLFIPLVLDDQWVGVAGVLQRATDEPFDEGDRQRFESIRSALQNMLALQHRCDELQRREIVTRAIPVFACSYCVVDEARRQLVWVGSEEPAVPAAEIWRHEQQIVASVEENSQRAAADEPVLSYPSLSFAQILRIVAIGAQPMFGGERCSVVALTAAQAMAGGLSPREKQIARLLLAGYTTINASAILSISENTIRTYVRRLYRKLNVVSRADLARKCALNYDMTIPSYQAAGQLMSGPT